MKPIRFTIAGKLILAFTIILVTIILSTLIIYRTLEVNRQTSQRVIRIYSPSSSNLHDLFFLVTNSKMLIKNWVYVDKKDSTPDKQKLIILHSEEYPALIENLSRIVPDWKTEHKLQYDSILSQIDSLFLLHKEVMANLNSFTSYEDAMMTMLAQGMVEDDGQISILSDKILKRLSDLAKKYSSLVEVANSEMEKSFSYFEKLILVVNGILLLSVVIIGFLLQNAMVSPIKYIRGVLLNMSKGILPKEKVRKRSDEIGDMADALNQLINGLEDTSKFALEIGNGNYEAAFTPLSKDDTLGNNLIIMKNNLKIAAEGENKRKREDFQRAWFSEGIAKFGEILRISSNDLRAFSEYLVKNLVRYLEANQGAMYIINDNDKIELTSLFAYNRIKSVENILEPGEGLIGRCVLEKETIFMTDIPEQYIKITSGLGQANPRSLLIVPLNMNQKVCGVLELASFRVFESYQIEFIEKLGETIASTIQNVKNNINTSRLLQESQEKSEKLAMQEEFTKQNIEEIKSIQEDLVRNHNTEIESIKNEYEEKIAKLKIKFNEEIEILKKDSDTSKK